MYSHNTSRLIGSLLAVAFAQTCHAADGVELPEIEVTADRPAPSMTPSPATTASVDRQQLQDTTNVINTSDALKYLPSLTVRKRNIGDTQAPLATRTSGLGQSARSLIYADGALLSALIGNNNSQASPRWDMVAPEEIARVDVMYGPYSAAYAGNSMGAVVVITTRMPERFEAGVKITAADQNYSGYATSDHFRSAQASVTLGSREGGFSWWISANHLDAYTQPVSMATATRPAATSAAGTPVSGGIADVNKLGQPIVVLGAGGLEHKKEDNLKLKLAYDFTPTLRGSYTIGLFQLDDHADAQSYLRDAIGNPVYGGNLNIGGYNYNVTTALSNGAYRFEENHLMQSLALKSSTGGAWDWEAVASFYDFSKDNTVTPVNANALQNGGAGANSKMGGTHWYTLDAKGIWRPSHAHEISFGAHDDEEKLVTTRYDVANWTTDDSGAVNTDSRGNTRTSALWLQDAWRLASDVKATLGGRYEQWRAFDGLNFSVAPASNVIQPEISASKFSPKATLEWLASDNWTATGSIGVAYRFPTVSELYQAITTGTTIITPNPNLRPEHAVSGELALEYAAGKSDLRVSLFQENLRDALISQNTLLDGSATFGTSFQNVDKVRSRGVEITAKQQDALITGLDFSGSVTWVDSRILADAAFRNAANVLTDVSGKRTPNIPSLRATAMVNYRPDDKWTLTLAGRYSSRVWTTIDNTDPVTHTWGGFDPYFVMDARVNYKIDPQWHVAVGVDNLNNRNYFLFHPFPQRTIVAEAGFNY